jgi:hypothetical protein
MSRLWLRAGAEQLPGLCSSSSVVHREIALRHDICTLSALLKATYNENNSLPATDPVLCAPISRLISR